MGCGTLPLPSPCPLPTDQRGVWSLQLLLLGSGHLAHLPLCCLLSSCLFSLGFRPFLIYTGTDQSKHSPCQSCSSASVEEPQGKYLQSRLCHKFPEALKGLWFLSCSLPLRVSHSSCPWHTQVQVVPLAPRGSAPCCPCACRGVQGEEQAPQVRFLMDGPCPSHPGGQGKV